MGRRAFIKAIGAAAAWPPAATAKVFVLAEFGNIRAAGYCELIERVGVADCLGKRRPGCAAKKTNYDKNENTLVPLSQA